MEDVRRQLEEAGLPEEERQAKQAIEQIDKAHAARKVSTEFLEELDDLYAELLSPLVFRRKPGS
jgi:hypothetical protein